MNSGWCKLSSYKWISSTRWLRVSCSWMPFGESGILWKNSMETVKNKKEPKVLLVHVKTNQRGRQFLVSSKCIRIIIVLFFFLAELVLLLSGNEKGEWEVESLFRFFLVPCRPQRSFHFRRETNDLVKLYVKEDEKISVNKVYFLREYRKKPVLAMKQEGK